jgi:hypothetical protein
MGKNDDPLIELQALKLLQNFKGFSKLVSYGTTNEGHNFLVLEQLGPSLKFLLRKTRKRKFSIKTTVQVGIQILDRFENLHS